jgi:acetyl esterase/lipase
MTSCSFRGVNRSKDITYLEDQQITSVQEQSLNVFSPKRSKELNDVFVFIHGGNWNSGRKGIYSFFGNRMARKGVVTVIIDYPLSPEATYEEMALSSARAVSWIHENIQNYGGDPDKIFVSGHSAGGHLAALIAVRDEYFSSAGKVNPIKGAIMIDAAGLDMYGYLQERNYPDDNTYIKTFTNDPDTWKEASPMYHLYTGMPPFLIYRGGKTYNSIIKSNEKFVYTLDNYVDTVNYTVQEGKKHVPMITQFIWTWNSNYKEILEFMESN